MTAPFLCGRVERGGGRWEGGKVGKQFRGSGSIKRRSATKIKFWFWYILERQANFGRGSRGWGGRGKKAAPRKKKKNMPRH